MTDYRLPEELDIRHIAEAHRLLSEAMAGVDEGGIQLDASAVSRIDTAGVQLLAAALKDPTDHPIVLRNPAPCVAEAFETLGMTTLLNS